MESEQPILGNHAISMTFDEVYMERSMGFVKALQELKSLRTQLCSASEYCEKTYLQNEQKQVVLDNIKDYAVRALVNAVDHLGTVAYKFTELIEQQSIDVSNVELQVSWLNQRLLTCQTHKDKEGLRQQQLMGAIPRYHKHYILPNYVNKKVHFSTHIQTDLKQHHYEARSPTGNVASKTLSWHLASEAKPTLKGAAESAGTGSVNENENVPPKAAGVFHLVDNGDPSARAHRRQSDPFGSSNKQWTGFHNAERGEGVGIQVRSKSALSAFFVKQKTPKLRLGSVI